MQKLHKLMSEWIDDTIRCKNNSRAGFQGAAMVAPVISLKRGDKDMEHINYDGHGGQCCGMRHVYDFCDIDEDIDEALAELHEWVHERPHNSVNKSGILVEAVLTDEQLKRTGLAEGLYDIGFRVVSRFRNSNSGNYCNILHFTHYPCDVKDSPFPKG